MDRKLKVLIVEDSADLRNLLKLALANEGYEVHLAIHGAEALQTLLAGQLRPDAILLDLMMPVMDGFEFLRRSRQVEQIADIPIIVCSASRVDMPERVDFLAKPVDLDDLLNTIESVIANVQRDATRAPLAESP